MSSTSFSPPPDWYEPPTPGPECLWCDGTRVVEVSSVLDVRGQPQSLQANIGNLIDCPRCDSTGVEPRPERETDSD